MMKRIILLIGLAMVLVSCNTTAADRGPGGIDGATWRVYCRTLVKLQTALGQIAGGTATADETVGELDQIQDAIAGVARAAGVDNPTIEKQTQAVADGVGKLKVAIAEGGDISKASDPLGRAIQALPSC